MFGFTILFAFIFYQAQVSLKVGEVYQVPLPTYDSLLSDISIDIDEERIKSKAIEVLSYLFADQFKADDYEVKVDTVGGYNNMPCYSVYFFNTKTQFEGYTIEFDIESGNIIYIWNNEFEYSDLVYGKEEMNEEKLEEAAEGYFKKISIDEVNDFHLTQKIYSMTGIQFTYTDSKDSQRVSIILVPETAAFMCYLREPNI